MVDRLSKTVQNELMNIVVIVLGLTVGATATAEAFLNFRTLGILVLGVIAFCLGTAGGVLLAKFMNLFSKEENKINPLIGSAASGIENRAYPLPDHHLGRHRPAAAERNAARGLSDAG